MIEWIVSSSVLICAVLLIRFLVKGKVNPRLQYTLWTLVLVRLLIPVSLFESSLSILNVRDDVMERPEVQQVSSSIAPPIQMGSQKVDFQQNLNISAPETQKENVENVSLTEKETYAGTIQTMDEPAASLAEILLFVWVLGMAAVAGGLVGCNIHFARRLHYTRQRLNVVYSPVEVYITNAIETPCLFGLFRPAIYLTPDVAADAQTRRYVLTHEITHYQHFDHIWSALRTVCLVLHWYNPLVWLGANLSRQDGEMACDEGTLLLLGEEHRGEYGRTLIGLTTRTRFTSALVTATTMTGGKRAIKERIVILMKKPKTALLTMIAVILVCGLVVGCTFTGSVEDVTETTEPMETTEPAETTEPVETTLPSESVQVQAPAGTVCLDQMIEGSDIRVAQYGKQIVLSEDGLTLQLSTDSVLVYRNGYVAAVMKSKPVASGEHIYVHEDFYDEFLCNKENEQPSLFHGVLFFANEILDALDQPEASVFNQKLLEEVLLPPSMNIETPHVDMGRVFQHRPLSEYPEVLAEELKSLGYENAAAFAYSEYVLLSGAQTQNQAEQQYSEAQLTFAAEKQIDVSDLPDLYRIFYGNYMEQSDEVLKAALEDCYETDMAFLQGWAEDYLLTVQGVELTAEQVEQANEALESRRYWEEDGRRMGGSYAIANCFTSYYSDPSELDFYDFMRYFSAYGVVNEYDSDTSEEEFYWLINLDSWPFGNDFEYENREWQQVPIHKTPAWVVEEVLQHYYGIGLEDLDDVSGVLYSEKYDSYYSFASDAGWGTFNCVGGRIYDGYVELYSNDAILTLREENGEYYIYSHLPIG